MSKTRHNRIKDLDGGRAFALPLTLIRHRNWQRLTPYAVKLITDLGAQYSGFNNGYLCPSWALMRERGWKSKDTLYRAIAECEHFGLIVRTQQGGLHQPNLFAFTWQKIDEKPGKPLEMKPTLFASDDWKNEKPSFEYQPKTKRPVRLAYHVGTRAVLKSVN